MPTYTTYSAKETRAIARKFTETLSGGDIVLLEGNLGTGKTTFIQGILSALGAKKPYTSPTFVIIKSYTLTNKKEKIKNGKKKSKSVSPMDSSLVSIPHSSSPVIHTVHHIDTYRIESHALLNLGWKEIIQEKNSIIFLEWPERVRDILPTYAKTIQFFHKEENKREIILPD